MNDTPRKPRVFVLDEDEVPLKPTVKINFEQEQDLDVPSVIPPAPLPSPKRTRWGLVLASSLGGLAVMWAGLSIAEFIESVFTRSTALGWVVAGVAGVAALAAIAIVAREIWGLARLRRIEQIQLDAAHAINTDDTQAANRAIEALKSLYGGRADAQWGLKSLAEHQGDILDPRDRVRLADRFLVAPRDAEAHRIIARAARRVTLLTTVTPAAALDILFVAAQNLRMLRELASLFGGRPSTLSTLRLARMVISHLAVTGGLALSDTLIQHVVGKGLLGRLSARFGEGAVNGIMTTRIGLAACDVCRPIPQEPSSKETLGRLLRELVTFGDDRKEG